MNITDPADLKLTLSELSEGFNAVIEDAVVQGATFETISYTLLLVIYRKGIANYGNFVQTSANMTRLNAMMMELGPRLEAEVYGHKIH